MATVTSAQPNSAALPAKQKPLFTAMRGTRPLNAAQRANEGTSSPAICVVTSVSPGRPPPPSVYMITGNSVRRRASNRRSSLR